MKEGGGVIRQLCLDFFTCRETWVGIALGIMYRCGLLRGGGV